MNSLSQQFYQKKQQDALNQRLLLAQNNELTTPLSQEDAAATPNPLKKTNIKPPLGKKKRVTWDETTFNKRFAQRHYSNPTIATPTTATPTYPTYPTQGSSTTSSTNGTMVSNIEWAEFEQGNNHTGLFDQIIDTCEYCSFLPHGLYTFFYLILFSLGVAAAAVGVLDIMHEKKPQERGYLFFATYGSLLCLLWVDVGLRLLASGGATFCHRTSNNVDVFMLVVGSLGLGMDILEPFHEDRIEKFIMLSDTCVVVLVSLVLFTRVVVLGCQNKNNDTVADEIQRRRRRNRRRTGEEDTRNRNRPPSLEQFPPPSHSSSQAESYSNYDYHRSHRKHRSFSEVERTGQRDVKSGGSGASGGRKSPVKTTVINLDNVAKANKDFSSVTVKNNNHNREKHRSQSFTMGDETRRSLLGSLEPL